MAIRTKMGSALVFTGRVYLGINDSKPAMYLEAHLASGDAGKAHFVLSELEADGGYEELRKSFEDAHNKLLIK